MSDYKLVNFACKASIYGRGARQAVFQAGWTIARIIRQIATDFAFFAKSKARCVATAADCCFRAMFAKLMSIMASATVHIGFSLGYARMFQAVTKFISHYVAAGWENTYWLMMEMDVTQWGIVSVVFVAAGFMALRTRF